MEYLGRIYPRYLVWRPLDHVAYERRGPAGQGSVFHSTEVFGRNPRFFTEIFAHDEQCDKQGLTLVERWGGAEVGRLHHSFTAVAGGTQYDTRGIIGSSGSLSGWVINRVLRPYIFSDEKAQAWLRHNVEEVGNFEHFLPELYALSMSGRA